MADPLRIIRPRTQFRRTDHGQRGRFLAIPAAMTGGRRLDDGGKLHHAGGNRGGIAAEPDFHVVCAKHQDDVVQRLLRQQDGGKRPGAVQQRRIAVRALRIVGAGGTAGKAFLDQLNRHAARRQLTCHHHRPAVLISLPRAVIEISPAVGIAINENAHRNSLRFAVADPAECVGCRPDASLMEI